MDDLLAGLPDALDLTDASHLQRTRELAETILLSSRDRTTLTRLEDRWARAGADVALMAQVAIKLALSRVALEQLEHPVHLSVVFAVFRERARILTHVEHPHGEDFLREKIRQLRWLFSDLANATWDLTVVDDGCPEHSGRIAQEILHSTEGLDDVEAQVLSLADAIESGREVTQPLRSTDESRKGGSILLGMSEAVSVPRAGHVVLFTDADLSTHLGQAGSLIAPLIEGAADAAIGSRREPTSISIKQGTRNLRGKLFIYLWKRLFPELRDIVDTQCGFKAFTAETVRDIVSPTLEKQFAFDIELLLKTELRRAGRIRRVPIAWIDSEAASTTTDLQPYLPMLRAMTRMARHYLPRRDEAEDFIALIESLDERRWERLLERLPAEIAEHKPHSFGDQSTVSAAELSALANG